MDSAALQLKVRHLDEYAVLGNQLGNELLELLPKEHPAIDRILNAQLQILSANIAIKAEIQKIDHARTKTSAG